MQVGISRSQIVGGSSGGGSGAPNLAFGVVTNPVGALNVSVEGARDFLMLSPLNGSVALSADNAIRTKIRGDSLIKIREISVNGSPAGESTNSSPVLMTANANDEKCSINDNFTLAGVVPTTNNTVWRSLFANTTGFGYSISLLADTNSRQVNLYLASIINAGANQTITVTARMEDGSSVEISQDLTNAAGTKWYRIPILFKAKTGTRLEITVLMKTPSGNNAELAFQGLTIS